MRGNFEGLCDGPLVVLAVGGSPTVGLFLVYRSSCNREDSLPLAVHLDLSVLEHLETPDILPPLAVGVVAAEVHSHGPCEHLAVAAVVVLSVHDRCQAERHINGYCAIDMLSLNSPPVISARFKCSNLSHFKVAFLVKIDNRVDSRIVSSNAHVCRPVVPALSDLPRVIRPSQRDNVSALVVPLDVAVVSVAQLHNHATTYLDGFRAFVAQSVA